MYLSKKKDVTILYDSKISIHNSPTFSQKKIFASESIRITSSSEGRTEPSSTAATAAGEGVRNKTPTAGLTVTVSGPLSETVLVLQSCDKRLQIMVQLVDSLVHPAAAD